jgi:hypothetical protein
MIGFVTTAIPFLENASAGKFSVGDFTLFSTASGRWLEVLFVFPLAGNSDNNFMQNRQTKLSTQPHIYTHTYARTSSKYQISIHPACYLFIKHFMIKLKTTQTTTTTTTNDENKYRFVLEDYKSFKI